MGLCPSTSAVCVPDVCHSNLHCLGSGRSRPTEVGATDSSLASSCLGPWAAVM